MIKKFIEVTFQMEFFHCWPDAPDEVAFLRNEHRHMAHVRARIGVNHNDRDLEFILVKRHLQEFTDSYLGTQATTSVSCEAIADAILNEIRREYPRREATVQVFEDGENGAIVEYTLGGLF